MVIKPKPESKPRKQLRVVFLASERTKEMLQQLSDDFGFDQSETLRTLILAAYRNRTGPRDVQPLTRA